MSHFTDIIAIHPYTAYRKGYFSNYKIYKKQIQYTMNFIRKGSFKDKPVFITEIGWSTSNSPQGISEETQKQFINNAICDAKRLEYQQLSYTNLMMHQVIFMTQNQDLVWLNTTV